MDVSFLAINPPPSDRGDAGDSSKLFSSFAEHLAQAQDEAAVPLIVAPPDAQFIAIPIAAPTTFDGEISSPVETTAPAPLSVSSDSGADAALVNVAKSDVENVARYLLREASLKKDAQTVAEAVAPAATPTKDAPSGWATPSSVSAALATKVGILPDAEAPAGVVASPDQDQIDGRVRASASIRRTSPSDRLNALSTNFATPLPNQVDSTAATGAPVADAGVAFASASTTAVTSPDGIPSALSTSTTRSNHRTAPLSGAEPFAPRDARSAVVGANEVHTVAVNGASGFEADGVRPGLTANGHSPQSVAIADGVNVSAAHDGNQTVPDSTAARVEATNLEGETRLPVDSKDISGRPHPRGSAHAGAPAGPAETPVPLPNGPTTTAAAEESGEELTQERSVRPQSSSESSERARAGAFTGSNSNGQQQRGQSNREPFTMTIDDGGAKTDPVFDAEGDRAYLVGHDAGAPIHNEASSSTSRSGRAEAQRLLTEAMQRFTEAQKERHWDRRLSIDLGGDQGPGVRLTIQPDGDGQHRIAFLVAQGALRDELKRAMPEIQEIVTHFPVDISEVSIEAPSDPRPAPVKDRRRDQ